jgi:hypothetical protein
LVLVHYFPKLLHYLIQCTNLVFEVIDILSERSALHTCGGAQMYLLIFAQ